MTSGQETTAPRHFDSGNVGSGVDAVKKARQNYGNNWEEAFRQRYEREMIDIRNPFLWARIPD